MEPVFAIAAGCVFTLAFLTLMRRNFLRMVIGFMLLSNAINLLIFTVGGLSRGASPVIPYYEKILTGAANPLPQALILTAIVISFGITAFSFTLAYRLYKTSGTLDTDELESDQKAVFSAKKSAPYSSEQEHLPA